MPNYNSDWIERNYFYREVTKPDDAIPRYEQTPRPIITCLCGSTRFWKEYAKVNFDLTTHHNRIVLSVGFYPRVETITVVKDGCMGPQEVKIDTIDMTQTGNSAEHLGITGEKKIELDNLHKEKIRLADEIYVINVGGYVGDSTKSEIEFAMKCGKTIHWLEPDKAWQPLPVVKKEPEKPAKSS